MTHGSLSTVPKVVEIFATTFPFGLIVPFSILRTSSGTALRCTESELKTFHYSWQWSLLFLTIGYCEAVSLYDDGINVIRVICKMAMLMINLQVSNGYPSWS